MSATLINVVLDLETLGTAENACIIQIGACVPQFDWKHILGRQIHFEATIAYEQCIDAHKVLGMEISNDTMQWWEQQPTRTDVFSGQQHYGEALEEFALWINSLKSPETDVAVWGNGSDFDNRLLAYSLSAFNVGQCWNFRNNRDLRTLRALFPTPKIDMLDEEKKHTALGDARYEARCIEQAYACYPHLRGIL